MGIDEFLEVLEQVRDRIGSRRLLSTEYAEGYDDAICDIVAEVTAAQVLADEGVRAGGG